MHRAKDAGGNCTRLYDPGTNEQAQVHLARRSELHNALRRDELRVLYQPQIDLRTGQSWASRRSCGGSTPRSAC